MTSWRAPVSVRYVTVTEITPCGWCGRGMPSGGNGRPRVYCKRSHRQRAFEARRLGEVMHLSDDEALVSLSELRALHDKVYVLEAALDDVDQDLAVDPDDVAGAYRHLHAAADALRCAIVTVKATTDGT